MYKRQEHVSLEEHLVEQIVNTDTLLGKKGNHFWREIIAQQTAQVADLGLYMLQLDVYKRQLSVAGFCVSSPLQTLVAGRLPFYMHSVYG